MNTKNYKYTPTKMKTWEAVFQNPQPVEMKTYNTGTIKCKVNGLISDECSKSELAKIPVLSHLVFHKKLGSILIDTGFNSSFSKKTGGSYKGIFKKAYFHDKYIQNSPLQGIDTQLGNININYILLTHIHEHASGAESFSPEIPIIFGNGEKELNLFPFIYTRFLENKMNLFTLDFKEAIDMPIVGKCIDIFGDNSIWAIDTSGHSSGHVSYLINGIDCPVLITGDACIAKRSYTSKKPPGYFSKYKEKGDKSFNKLVEFIDTYSKLKVIFGHETEEFKIEYMQK